MTRLGLPMIVVTAMIAGCSGQTATEPTVTSSSGAGTTVEYSGERSGQAGEKAQQACEQHGKRAVARSLQPGPSGGTVRSYDCH